MTDYTNMTPEQESALVPEWATQYTNWQQCRRWVAPDGATLLEEHYPLDADVRHLRIASNFVLDKRTAGLFANVIQFFAANGRLPRRIEREVEA